MPVSEKKGRSVAVSVTALLRAVKPSLHKNVNYVAGCHDIVPQLNPRCHGDKGVGLADSECALLRTSTRINVW